MTTPGSCVRPFWRNFPREQAQAMTALTSLPGETLAQASPRTGAGDALVGDDDWRLASKLPRAQARAMT